MTLLLDLLIALAVAGGIVFGYVLMRLSAGGDAHIELLTPAMRERLRNAAPGRPLPRLHRGPPARPV